MLVQCVDTNGYVNRCVSLISLATIEVRTLVRREIKNRDVEDVVCAFW